MTRISDKTIKGIILAIIMMIASVSAYSAELTITGSRVIPVTPEASTGLEKIYVIEDMNGAVASYPSASARWGTWSWSAVDAQPETPSISGNSSYITLDNSSGYGITVEDAGRMHHFWVVNYEYHNVDFTGLNVNDSDGDCNSMHLDIEGEDINTRSRINYYTINGASKLLDRGYKLSYYNLRYNEETNVYDQFNDITEEPSLSQSIRVNKPLCDTRFTLSGDRFAEQWGTATTVESDTYYTDAVEARTYAEKVERDNDNEQSDGTTGLGGSAPVDITFVAAVTDAVKFTEWQLSSSPDFDNYELRFNQTEVEYTFTEYGTWYMRFQASNADGSCDYFSPTYEIQIGESRLQCPNAFSPGASEGVNDEWKVSYKSIVDFECHIFNRWGVKIITLNDPSQGWDGKYNGKLVPSGVYYYVIKARGADGHKYNLSGDINIIRYNQTPGQSVTEE